MEFGSWKLKANLIMLVRWKLEFQHANVLLPKKMCSWLAIFQDGGSKDCSRIRQLCNVQDSVFAIRRYLFPVKVILLSHRNCGWGDKQIWHILGRKPKSCISLKVSFSPKKNTHTLPLKLQVHDGQNPEHNSIFAPFFLSRKNPPTPVLLFACGPRTWDILHSSDAEGAAIKPSGAGRVGSKFLLFLHSMINSCFWFP